MHDQHVLSRHLINPDTQFVQVGYQEKLDYFDYQSFSDMVDYWKILLWEKYGARPGQKVVIEFNLTNIYYFAAVFAAWELGLVMITDWIHANDELQARGAYFRIHGPIDLAIVYSPQFDRKSDFYNRWDCLRTKLNCRLIVTEKDFDQYEIKNHGDFKKVAKTIFAKPDSQAIWTATSGSTGMPKQQKTTHKSAYLQAQRLCRHLGIEKNDVILHTNNLHHGASACYHFLPGLSLGSKQFILNYRYHVNDNDHSDRMNRIIVENKINRLFLYTTSKMNYFLDCAPIFNHRVDITTLYYCTKDTVKLAADKNVNSIKSVFGDTTIGYGFLVKSVFPTRQNLETYEPNLISAKLDNFFDFIIKDGHLYVCIPGLGETTWKTSFDNFELRDGQYYFAGRGTEYRIDDEWVNHHEIEQKVSKLFDDDWHIGATIIADNEAQQIYLVVWRDNKEAEAKLIDWFSKKYKKAKINQIFRNLDQQDFMGSRKISRHKLREHCRQFGRSLDFAKELYPWMLS
jgi:acyl-CoA synthetase (AMP-forming)/AMP-acid ligase II